MKSMIEVKNEVKKQTVTELTTSILKVLNTAAGDTVKQEAIRAIAAVGSPNATISHCNLLNTERQYGESK